MIEERNKREIWPKERMEEEMPEGARRRISGEINSKQGSLKRDRNRKETETKIEKLPDRNLGTQT